MTRDNGSARRIRQLPGVRRLLITSAATSALSALLTVAQANLLAVVLARVALTAPPVGSLLPLSSALAGVYVLRAGLARFRTTVSRSAASRVKADLRHRLFDAIGRLGPARLARERGGELATVAGTGLDGLDAYLSEYLPQLTLTAVVPVVVVARLAGADPISAGIVAATLPLIPLFGALIGWHTRSAARGQWRALAQLGGHFLDVLRGLPTLRAFGRAQHQVGVVGRVAADYRIATMRTLRIAFLSGLALDLVGTLSVALVAVPIGLRLLDGTTNLTTALLVLLLAPEAYRPLRDLGSAFHTAAAGQAAAERAFTLIDAAPSTPAVTVRRAAQPRSDTVVELHAVTVRHPGADRPALREVDLVVATGARVALVGPSGAGKSTVLELVVGLLAPESGSTRLGASDLRELLADEDALARWRRQVAWVPQRPHLFAGTIAANIALGMPSASRRRIREAAEAASAADFVEALPERYDTVLGERGGGLSAGQRQRIALARAFLRDAPLLLLDEPTAALDAGTEATVTTAIRRLLAGRTAIVATHRPALLGACDQVVSIADGHVHPPVPGPPVTAVPPVTAGAIA